MSSEIAIKVENLSKCYQIYDQPRNRLKQFFLPSLKRSIGLPPKQYYREFWALKDVSFEIKKGETVGIIGCNGSGKSTLLQMICGILSPTSGSVATHGRVAALLELGSGFNPEFTGRENVYMNASVFGLTKNEIDERFDDIAAVADIGEFIEQPVKSYSSGMYARLAFSVAINIDPEILIVDEALAVGDARFVAKCMTRIKVIQESGASILFVSHDVGSVRTLCERAIWLDRGRLIEQGDVFPVTGQFTEFMFKDEENDEDISRDDLSALARLTLSLEAPTEDNIPTPMVGIVQEVEDNETEDNKVLVSAKSLPVINAKPVNHWGSHKGLILSACVLNEYGIKTGVLAWGEQITVMIKLKIPEYIPREHLSIALSIKDLKGTDLIVSTTHDFGPKHLPDRPDFSVSFRFANPLITGKYLLVAAVENRQYHNIHYYEYFEGAQYFASLSNQRFFGLFQPVIEQQVEAL